MYLFTFNEKIKSIKWLDNGEDVVFTQDGEKVTIINVPQLYGEYYVVRIAKIEI